MEKKFLYILLGLFFCCFITNQNIYSQDTTIVDYFEMSLDELMNITVTSATKSEMSIRKSPGVVRVFTSKDFENYGFSTLTEE